MELQKKATKLKLKDIPGALSPFRLKFIDGLTTSDIYKNTIKSGIPGFSEEELSVIEKRYEKQGGLLQSDIQNELKNKGWQVRQNTIKHYLKVGQLPKPTESRGKKTSRGAFSLYPTNFMRHLNFVRFMLNAGRNLCEDILKSSDVPLPSSGLNDYFLLEMCCAEGDEDFVFCEFIWGHISSALSDGFIKARWAIKSAESLVNGEIDNSTIGNLRRKTFERIQEQFGSSDNLKNAIKLRLKKYSDKLNEIETSLIAIQDKVESLESETKNALWTITN